jgi:FKBP-type peptidyl-prolyl cis-trans isomerase
MHQMKKTNGIRFLLTGMIIGLGTLLLSGCLENEWEKCIEDGKVELDDYIAQHSIPESYKVEVTGGYIYNIPVIYGTGLSPEANDFIVVDYTGMYVDGTIIETTDSTLREDWGASTVYTDYVYGPMKFQYGYSSDGFNEGLALMQEGGLSTLIIPTELAYYNCRPVIYYINLLTVIENPVAYEKEMLVWCLSENGMDTVSNAYNDIYYKEISNTGDVLSVTKNDTLLIRFTASYPYEKGGNLLLKEFDSNISDKDPLKIVYGSDVVHGGSIKFIPDGFTAALDTMSKGTHALAVLPYDQAFGTTGLINATYGYFIVPQYQTVIYDILVEDIRRP